MFAKARDTLRSARLVKRLTGKSVASQAIEIARLRFGRTQLGPGDYYALDLFEDVSFDEKSRFAGWRASADIDARLNAASSRVLAKEKRSSMFVTRTGASRHDSHGYFCDAWTRGSWSLSRIF